MALLKPTPPPAVTLALTQGLMMVLDGPTHGTMGPLVHANHIAGPVLAPTQADVGMPGNPGHNPQQVFVLGLSALANGLGLAAARQDGWRIFAGTTQGRIALGRINQLPTLAWKLRGCFYWDRVWDAFQESVALENLPAIQNGNYELRLLSIPGLNLEAFWLVARPPSAGDLMVPFPAAPNQPIPRLNVPGPFPVNDFLSFIRPLAQQRVAAPAGSVS